jgi:hypothetical protein
MEQIDAAIKIQNGLIDVTIDYSKITYLIEKIQEKERFINKYHYIDEIDQILNDKEMYITELRQYCKEHNIKYEQIIYKYHFTGEVKKERQVV